MLPTRPMPRRSSGTKDSRTPSSGSAEGSCPGSCWASASLRVVVKDLAAFQMPAVRRWPPAVPAGRCRRCQQCPGSPGAHGEGHIIRSFTPSLLSRLMPAHLQPVHRILGQPGGGCSAPPSCPPSSPSALPLLVWLVLTVCTYSPLRRTLTRSDSSSHLVHLMGDDGEWLCRHPASGAGWHKSSASARPISTAVGSSKIRISAPR